MARARKKSIARSASVQKSIASAVDKIEAACGDTERAVAERSKINKKLTAEVRRLNKRRGLLVRRKKKAAEKARSAPSVETRKALRAVERDLAATRRDLTKARAAKAANRPELAELKTAQRQAKAYQKAIVQANKVLDKPKKRARRAKKKR